MLFEFTEVERDRFEDLLYELRHVGYTADVFYDEKTAEVKAFQDFETGRVTVGVVFSRYGTQKLQVLGRVAMPSGEELEFIRIAPLVTCIKSCVRKLR